MKPLSERYFEEKNNENMTMYGTAIFNEKELKRYGEICRLEGELNVYDEGMIGHKINTKQLNQIAKEENL